MLCGISPRFRGLSPSWRKVAHVLLTRLPLYSGPEGPFRVRLACLIHAASVRSEPGSNSPLSTDLGSRASETNSEDPFKCVLVLRYDTSQTGFRSQRVCFSFVLTAGCVGLDCQRTHPHLRGVGRRIPYHTGDACQAQNRSTQVPSSLSPFPSIR